MTLNIEHHNEKNVLKIDGDFTVYSAVDALDTLKESLDMEKDIEFELSSISEIDSCGLQLLTLVAKQAQKNDRSVNIASTNDVVEAAFKISHIRKAINCK